jgi:hypothetical protein
MVHPTGSLSLLGEKIGVAETLWTYTREVLGLNLDRVTRYPNVSRGFAVRSGKYRDRTSIKLWQLPSKYFLIHYSLGY